MDTRRLEAFVKVVDLGSVSRAAKLLNIAQPALSQQIASLELDFKRKLLDRSARGVRPTEAGHILYRYAKSIQRQIDEARRTILDNQSELTGNVTIGLAPLSSATLLATPLLKQVRERFPSIVLHIYDSFGIVLSELMLKGSMDMAVLYGDRPVTGLDYKPLMREHFFLVAPHSMCSEQPQSESVSAAEVAQFDLILPYRESFLRQRSSGSALRLGSVRASSPRSIRNRPSRRRLRPEWGPPCCLSPLQKYCRTQLSCAFGRSMHPRHRCRCRSAFPTTRLFRMPHSPFTRYCWRSLRRHGAARPSRCLKCRRFRARKRRP